MKLEHAVLVCVGIVWATPAAVSAQWGRPVQRTQTQPTQTQPTQTQPAQTPPAQTQPAQSAQPETDDDEDCENGPRDIIDPSRPNLELNVGGGYGAFFLTYRQQAAIDDPGRHPDGLYHGPVVRGEVSFGLGAIWIAAVYTHVFAQLDATPSASLDMAFFSGEFGFQCACTGNVWVWSFSLELGWDINNDTLLTAIEHRSMFYLWEGLFVGFDLDATVLFGLTTGGGSGGGLLGSVFVGYTIGG